MTRSDIEAIVLDAVRQANLGRRSDAQMAVTPDAPLFGPDSPLDSLGLVALLVDVEDALADRGLPLSLSDASAMSASRSPFRDVPSLVSFIGSRVAA